MLLHLVILVNRAFSDSGDVHTKVVPPCNHTKCYQILLLASVCVRVSHSVMKRWSQANENDQQLS